MAIRIHQIYYDDRQQAGLDPAFIPYDNRANARPDWREYHVFRSAYRAGLCAAGDVTGFVSWKFRSKTRLSGARFIDLIRRHPGSDVYFVNPDRIERGRWRSVWEQGEFHHPGILGLAQRIFSTVGVAIDLARFEQPPEHVAYCNYWAGGGKFWDAYMAFCEPVHECIEHGLSAADRDLIHRRADRTIDACFIPFIMERLFSTLLTLRPDLHGRGWNATQLGWAPGRWWRRIVRRRPA